MKEIKNFILIVDGHRRPSRCRNTHGVYRVGAKTPQEAVELLRAKIGFGSIQVKRQSDYYDNRIWPMVSYKTVVKVRSEVRDGKMIGWYEEPLHANAGRRNRKGEES